MTTTTEPTTTAVAFTVLLRLKQSGFTNAYDNGTDELASLCLAIRDLRFS